MASSSRDEEAGNQATVREEEPCEAATLSPRSGCTQAPTPLQTVAAGAFTGLGVAAHVAAVGLASSSTAARGVSHALLGLLEIAVVWYYFQAGRDDGMAMKPPESPQTSFLRSSHFQWATWYHFVPTFVEPSRDSIWSRMAPLVRKNDTHRARMVETSTWRHLEATPIPRS